MARSTKQKGSTNRRAESPAGQARVEIPEPEHEAEAGGDVSTREATLEASPMLPGCGKEAMPATKTGGPSGLRKIKRTIRRSSK